MNKTLLFLALITSVATLTTISYSQSGSTGLPFLMIPTSVEANGMGGISTVANASSPSSMLFNPAQIGMHTQSNFFSTELNSKPTLWLPAFNLNDLWITNSTIVYGMKMPLDEKSSFSMGVGYSRVFLNLGEFIVTTEAGPDAVASFKGYEASDNFSAGVGIDAGYKIAVGTTFKKITSSLSPIGTAQERGNGKAQLWAWDFGIVGSLPIVPFMERKESQAENIAAPFLFITGAYAVNNIGGGISYAGSPSDPLPRTARLGLSANAGFSLRVKNTMIEMVNVTIAREAENLLFERFNDGSWKYTGSYIGKINITQNILNGEAHGYVCVRRGFSAGILETVVIRSGSYEGDGNLVYKTSGYSISTLGLSKYISSSIPDQTGFNPIEFFASHLEIRFNHSAYTEHPILNGTEFDTVVFSFRY